MTTFFRFREAGLEEMNETNFRVQQSIEMRCTPAQLMDVLRGESVWTQWLGALESVEWTSEGAPGPGATRNVYLKGGDVIREVFFIWEEDHRVAFYVEEGTMKDVSIFAEDYQIEATDKKMTRLTWTIALQLDGPAGLVAPVTGFLTRIAVKGWLKKLKQIVENPGQSERASNA